MEYKLFTAESVSPGHPDKLMDYIGDSILDYILERDPHARVAIDGVIKDKYLTLGGEVTTSIDYIDYESIVKQSLLDLGYHDLSLEVEFTANIFKQSPDIALGTNDDVAGAGDQGTITGYACAGNPTLIPLEKALADELMLYLYLYSRKVYNFLRPDMKSQVTIYYDDNNVPHIHTVILALQHTEDATQEQLEEVAQEAVNHLADRFDVDILNAKIIVNGTGRFIIGGPYADSGEIGRKIVADQYGVRVPVGGGNLNAKDPSKVDRSAAYYARYVAQSIVREGLADEVLITVSYCIGLSQPISVNYDFKGTNHFNEDFLVRELNKITDFSPSNMIKELDLLRPIYATSGLFGHYGRSKKFSLRDESVVYVPWEHTDLINKFQDLRVENERID